MLSRVLLCTLFTLSRSVDFLFGEKEFQIVCVGKEFRLPVHSVSRIVTFTPNSPPGPRRVLLENNHVKDMRFEWTRDRMLVLKEVTHSDQGLYAIKLSSGFTYEIVRLNVSECIKSYRRTYGETFQHSIPEDGALLQFSPRDSLPESQPVVLWNRTDPESGKMGRGRLQRDGRVWLAERVTQADQGNYTIRDGEGKVLSRSILTVHGHIFNVTRFTKESLNIPLFILLHQFHLIFTPARDPDQSTLGPFGSRPPLGPVELIQNGQVLDRDMRYRGLVSLGRNGNATEVVIARLNSRHDGWYDIRDLNYNLVSSTSLHVNDKFGRWRAVLKSITVPSGMFVSLAGFILFMKRYPSCSLSQIINCLRANNNHPASPPQINIQDYSHASPQTSRFYGYSQQPETPQKWSKRASLIHTGYTPVMVDSGSQLSQVTVRTENQRIDTLTAGESEDMPNERGRKISFSVPGSSDCLHLSEDCAQFYIKDEGEKKRWSRGLEYFSKLPLDTDTPESCSVYTSDKLNF
ncbi:uncharacterized protein LOC130110204 [Lampris incognitus]|uniref:uncharacterized protein LOC130110204 n=1 Tax=Lampris incognitus TaxID=2546036 RepID=UPI0024B4FD14|nr:uncharacterized protein LOC130110204 [Lampris incognitus]